MKLLHMAAGYRQSAEMIRLRIIDLRDEAQHAQPEQRAQLEQRIRDLRTLQRETQETALVLERYYDRGYHKNERYTF